MNDQQQEFETEGFPKVLKVIATNQPITIMSKTLSNISTCERERAVV